VTRKRRNRTRRTHSVAAHLRVHELSKAGTSLDLEIYERERKIGTLIVGRGSLFWRGGKRQIEKRVPWDRFAAMMDALAYGD